MAEKTEARERYRARRVARAKRRPKGVPGFTPRQRGIFGAESAMREQRTITRHVLRKLRQGRPGRPSNAPRPTFDWEKVTNDSKHPEPKKVRYGDRMRVLR